MITIEKEPFTFHLEGIVNSQPADLMRHSQNVANLSIELAGLCGCGEAEVSRIYMGCLLHDIGKQFILPGILNKSGKFTQEEFAQMKIHPWKGYTYLNNLVSDHIILNTVLYHHERWNGSGYPYGLRANEIPLGARICAVIDVWDALISDRCYRSAWSMMQACDLICTGNGSLFDPDVVCFFLQLVEERSAEGMLHVGSSMNVAFRSASQHDRSGFRKSFVPPGVKFGKGTVRHHLNTE